jgi:dTDP-3-amino-3,4,6-trideoxy-alpha-D-glucose transaminase
MSLQANHTLPLIDLKRQYETIKPEIQQAINTVLEQTDFIMGQAVGDFEAQFATFCGAKYAVGVASGTAAIHLVLHALGVGAGDEVITVGHTFIASAEPIISMGAKPVFVDVEPDYFTLDPAKLEAAITPRTKAIMPVHLYGQPADLASIQKIAERYRIPIIEDAAQAHGAVYRGQKIGAISIATCFSFYPGKNLGAYGDAGAITTNDDQLAARVRRLRNHGRKDKYEHLEPGYGERLDTLQAAILRVKLTHLADWNERRRYWAAYYDEALGSFPELQIPAVRPDCEHVYHLYVIRHPRRDALMVHLKNAGIQAGVHYPIPLHLQLAFKDLGLRRGDFPVTEALAESVLSLPIFPEMTEAEANRVSEAIRQFFI